MEQGKNEFRMKNIRSKKSENFREGSYVTGSLVILNKSASLPNECMSAALARILVESRTGKDVSSGGTISGISVHPRTIESHPSDLNSLIT